MTRETISADEFRETFENENAMSALAFVRRAARQFGLTPSQQDAWMADATSGDHDHLMSVCERVLSGEYFAEDAS
jgi:hypothetical protein